MNLQIVAGQGADVFNVLWRVALRFWMPATHIGGALLVAGLLALAAEGDHTAEAAQARVPAPDFDGATSWLNTDKPLSLAELRGRVVLLDFWTLC